MATLLEAEYATYNFILRPFLQEDLEIGRMYPSPLPDHPDDNPSFQVFKGENFGPSTGGVDFEQMLFWKDWGYGQHKGHRPIHLLQHLYREIPVHELRRRLRAAEKTEIGAIAPKLRVKSPWEHQSSFDYTSQELAFWTRRFHVSASTLRKYDVMGTRKIWKDEKEIYSHDTRPPCFTYMGPGGMFQLYRPGTRKEPKWIRRSVGHSFLLGYKQLSYRGNILLLMSGMKDGLCMHEVTGWDFLAASGENDYRSYLEILPELQERFDYIGVCMDPDPAGRKASLLLQHELGLPEFPFPYPNDKWDVADCMEKFGPDALRKAFYLNTFYRLKIAA